MEVFEIERWTQYSEEDIKFMRREYRRQRYILKFITAASLLLAFFSILWVGLAFMGPFIFETDSGTFYYLMPPADFYASLLFLPLLTLPKKFYLAHLKKTMSEDEFTEFNVALNGNINLAPSKKLAWIFFAASSVLMVYLLLFMSTSGTTLVRVSENSIYLSGNSRSWFPEYYVQQYNNLNDIVCRSIGGVPHLVLEEPSGRQYTYRLTFSDMKTENLLSIIDEKTENRYRLIENSRK